VSLTLDAAVDAKGNANAIIAMTRRNFLKLTALVFIFSSLIQLPSLKGKPRL